jgi:hypothetical protein
MKSADTQFYSRLPTPCTPSLLSLRVLYAYMADNLDAATRLLLEQSAHLAPESSALEHALQLLVKITHFHRLRHSLPAAIPRSILEQAIDSFPNNTSFLSLYLWGECTGVFNDSPVTLAVKSLLEVCGRSGPRAFCVEALSGMQEVGARKGCEPSSVA